MQKVFILGNPRSGTSLLRLMLNSHPAIAAPPESGFLHWWYPKYKYWNAEDSQSTEKVLCFIDDILTSKKIETWCIDKNKLVEFIHERKPLSYSELGSLVYIFWAMTNRKSPYVIVDKNNYYIHHLNDLISIWPDAKFIFLIRDGRDVACSYLDIEKLETTSPYKPVLPTTIKTIAEEWQRNNSNIYEFLNTLPKERWRMIKYEDIVMNTRIALIELVSFLNLEFSEQMLLYYLANNEPASTMDWKKKTLEKPDVLNIGRYKSRLKPDDVELFNRIASPMLNFTGYGE